MFPSLSTRTTRVFEALKRLTEDAVSDMEATQDLSARKTILARWERMLGGQVRQEYQDLKRGIDASSNHSQDEKEALRKKLGPLTKQMVLDRSLLEGLAQGKGPAPHNAGGAFPPPGNVEPALVAKVEGLLQQALGKFEQERDRHVAGELFGDFITRCDRPLKSSLEHIESILKASGAEYRELLERLRKVTASALGEAITERGQANSDQLHQQVCTELHADYFNNLRRFKDEIDGSVDRTGEARRIWAKDRLRVAQARLEAAAIEADLTSELVWFERELKSLVGDVKGLWDRPPVFEPVTINDLDPRANSQEFDGQDGVYLSFYPDGHLSSAVLIHEGSPSGRLSVDRSRAHARYEDSANIAEFHPDGTIEEYGGRYEHEHKARITFHDWVVLKVEEMLS